MSCFREKYIIENIFYDIIMAPVHLTVRVWLYLPAAYDGTIFWIFGWYSMASTVKISYPGRTKLRLVKSDCCLIIIRGWHFTVVFFPLQTSLYTQPLYKNETIDPKVCRLREPTPVVVKGEKRQKHNSVLTRAHRRTFYTSFPHHPVHVGKKVVLALYGCSIYVYLYTCVCVCVAYMYIGNYHIY